MTVKESGYPSIDKSHNKIFNFSQNHPIIPNMSIYNALKYMSLFYRQTEAIDCLDLSVTYDELIKNAAIIARSFKTLGLKKGDIVTVDMPNFYQAVAVYLAANQIGVVTTFLNPFSSSKEIKHYLNLFESPLLVNFDKSREYNDDIRRDTKVRNVITLQGANLNVSTFNNDDRKLIGYDDYLDFQDLQLVANHGPKIYNTNFTGKNDALILFTSGSTGNPKSVVLTNENLLASGIYMKKTINLPQERKERCLVCVPFCYPYGFATSTIMTLLCGRVAVLAPNLSKENINYYLNKENNYIFGSPALLELMMRNAQPQQDLSSIHSFISGGDFLTQQKAEEAIKFFQSHGAQDAVIYNGSGNAETTATSTSAVGAKIKPETVGRLLAGSEAIIIDTTQKEGDHLITDDKTGRVIGREVKYGEEGVLCISGKHIFKEYFGDPKLTEEVKFVYKGKTYFITGTLGYLDEERYFGLTGRASRFYIIENLNKVYCDKVQNIISSIDVIDSCAVVERSDDENLAASKAFIVLKEGVPKTNDTLEYIKKMCHSRFSLPDGDKELLSYEIPADFEFVDSLPRTVADKIDYETLKKQAQKEYDERKKVKVLKK